jgi:hypothetical protein
MRTSDLVIFMNGMCMRTRRKLRTDVEPRELLENLKSLFSPSLARDNCIDSLLCFLSFSV